jgi:hypothetical protein
MPLSLATREDARSRPSKAGAKYGIRRVEVNTMSEVISPDMTEAAFSLFGVDIRKP